jgi:hypothetical protein
MVDYTCYLKNKRICVKNMTLQLYSNLVCQGQNGRKIIFLNVTHRSIEKKFNKTIEAQCFQKIM